VNIKCLFHAIQALQREICEKKYHLNKGTRNTLKDLFALLENSKNESEYERINELIRVMGSHGKSFHEYFDNNWNTQEMRALWSDQNCPELSISTSRRWEV
jgi:hypothetical protein